MADPEDKKSTLDDLEARAQRAAAEAAVSAAAAAAREGVERAGTGLLDALEVAIFGRVGGAEARLETEKIPDPLDRLRAKYGSVEVPKAPDAPVREDPVAKARAELERLKAEAAAKKAGGAVEPEPVKKTL